MGHTWQPSNKILKCEGFVGCCSVVKVRKEVTSVEPTQETHGENLLIRLRLLSSAWKIWLHNMMLCNLCLENISNLYS